MGLVKITIIESQQNLNGNRKLLLGFVRAFYEDMMNKSGGERDLNGGRMFATAIRLGERHPLWLHSTHGMDYLINLHSPNKANTQREYHPS